MKKLNIPISRPNLTIDDQKELVKCFKSSWISSKSPWVNKFEKSFAKNVSGTQYACAVNSGTSALFLALTALGIGSGDEVIIPTLTMIATINAIKWAGATPVLVDSESETDWNISIKGIKKAINKKTKAIIPVHIYGYPCDMENITRIARKHKLYVIEDAAEAIGSYYQNKKIGSFGDMSCFSLYANKVITTGNGGMVALNNQELYERIKKISFFDFNEGDHFNHRLFAYNLVMTGLQAALGLSQLTRLKEHVNSRKKVFEFWKKYLVSDNYYFLHPLQNAKPNYWFPGLIFKSGEKRKCIEKILMEHGIETRRFFRPIHEQILYQGDYGKLEFPNSEYFFDRGLLLPSYVGLRQKSIKEISKIINENC